MAIVDPAWWQAQTKRNAKLIRFEEQTPVWNWIWPDGSVRDVPPIKEQPMSDPAKVMAEEMQSAFNAAKVMNECNPEGSLSIQAALWRRLDNFYRDLDKIRHDVAHLAVDDEDAKSAEWWMDKFHNEKDRADNQQQRAEKLAKRLDEAVEFLQALKPANFIGWRNEQVLRLQTLLALQTPTAAPKEPCPECKGSGSYQAWDDEIRGHIAVSCPACQPKEATKRIRVEDLEMLEKVVACVSASAKKEALGRILAACREMGESIDWAAKAGELQARVEAAEKQAEMVIFDRENYRQKLLAAEKEVERLKLELSYTDNEFRKEYEQGRKLTAERDRLQAALEEKEQAKLRPCGFVELPGLPTYEQFRLVTENAGNPPDWWVPERKKALADVVAFARRALEAAGMVTKTDLDRLGCWTSEEITKALAALKKLRGS